MHYCWGLLIFGKIVDLIAQTLFVENWTDVAITHPDSCCFYYMCHFCFLTCWTARYRVTPEDDMELNSLSPQEWMLCSMVFLSNITGTTVILLEGKLSGLYVKCWGTSVKCYDVNMHRQSGVVREVAILLVALIFPPLSLSFSLSRLPLLSLDSIDFDIQRRYGKEVNERDRHRRCC